MLVFRVLISILIIFLSSCASLSKPPKDEKVINQSIQYEYDKFEKVGWLSSEYYSHVISSYPHEELRYYYRAAFSEKGDLLTIQLYMDLLPINWYFIDRIRDSEGNKYQLVRIDRKVKSGITESFALTISLTDLKKFSKEEKFFKLIGKRGDVAFSLSQPLSSAFLKRIEQRNSPN